MDVVILNGFESNADHIGSSLLTLTDVLEHNKYNIRCYHLNLIKLAHCTGCFGCWVKTPGICVSPDEGRKIVRDVMQSDIAILLSPVTFGGYSSALKIIVDRFIPIVLPFFGKYFGETHHLPRYSHYPRLVAIGVQQHYDKKEAELFQNLVGRNAINFHAPTFSVDIIDGKETNESLAKRFQDLLSRSDSLPIGNMASFFPNIDLGAFNDKPQGARNALLIVGSPKIKSRSTSSILGEHLLEILTSAGWKSAVLTLKANLNREKGQNELCLAVDRADLIIFSFPLYIDSLPYLVTKAFEVIARHKTEMQREKPQKMFTIINNGFPEFPHNALALAMCRRFADRCGMVWAGSLAMGAGEALGAEQDLSKAKRTGPPVNHVIQALEKAGTALASDMAVPADAQSLISRTPVPLVSFSVWRWMFEKIGGRWWIKKAAENGIEKKDMYAQPYAG